MNNRVEGWNVDYNGPKIEIINNKNSKSKVFDLKHNQEFDWIHDTIYIGFDDGTSSQFKLLNDHVLVIDEFDEEEQHVKTIGTWDFDTDE